MASSSSSSSCAQEKYDVFLSFRGEDTRDNFTSHLYASLRRKKIKTFIDNELKRGDEISPALLKTIEESKVSVIIFSKDFASSKWCLDEIEKILECKKKKGQIVIPVFYHINPSDVRRQTGNFAEAFAKHEAYLKERIDRVQNWRDALTEVSNLAGYDSLVIRPESMLVDEIVRDILKKLSSKSSFDSNGLIGINSRTKAINSLLKIGLSDFCSVGIWGMGGSGKTTIAKAIFRKISRKFESCCFLANVREEFGKRGPVRLQEELLSKLLGEESPNMNSTFTKDRLRRTKVFIVLDDVDNSRQLEILEVALNGFGPGSRLIVTTRDKQVLNNFGVSEIYKVTGLNAEESLQLFCQHAFKQSQPIESHLNLSKRVVEYAKGLPLALKVLGSHLYGRSEEQWESALNKLGKVPNIEIHDVLKISYDGLDREEKDIFLDVACFFKGWERARVETILNDFGFAADVGVSVLIDRCLLTISGMHDLQQEMGNDVLGMHDLLQEMGNEVLGMHDLLQEMGLEIVRQESIKKPGKRSRLWDSDDVCHVLNTNTGTETVECISLDISEGREMQLSSKTFKRMRKLRMLKFFQSSPVTGEIHRPQGLEYLPHSLSYLHWEIYPLKSLPSNFNPENLVKLNLCKSSSEKLWDEVANFVKLKEIDLSYSEHLIKIPDFSRATNLERLYLSNCKSLIELPSYVGGFHKLIDLVLFDCTQLKIIPSGIFKLKSIESIILPGCSKLERFLDISEKIEDLSSDGTATVAESHLTIMERRKMRKTCVAIGDCINIERLPATSNYIWGLLYSKYNLMHYRPNVSYSWGDCDGICNLKYCRLDVSYCSNLKTFPDIWTDIEEILLERSGVEEVPLSIGNLSNLKLLDCKDCKRLKDLPRSISNLTSLQHLSLSGCLNITKVPQVSGDLETLDLSGMAIDEVPSSIGYLSNLKLLDCKDCKRLKDLPRSISNLTSLQHLILSGCSNITQFPLVSGDIKTLDLSGTKIDKVPSSIGSLSNLRRLDFTDCKWLNNLPRSISNLTSLRHLILSRCSKITQFALVLGDLETFDVSGTEIDEVPSTIGSDLSGTEIDEVPSSIGSLSNLRLLDFTDCKRLNNLPRSINNLTSLRHLILHGCSNITEFPQVSGDLETLDLTGTAIEGVPLSLSLPKLKYLGFENCLRLGNLPSSISNLTSLKRLILFGCSNITEFPQVPQVSGDLETLDLIGMTIEEMPWPLSLLKLKYLGLPSSIKFLSKDDYSTELVSFILSRCSKISRESLILSGCSNIIEFPQVPQVSGDLETLDLIGTAIEEVPWPLSLPKLKYLGLPSSIRSLSKVDYTMELASLILSRCSKISRESLILSRCSNFLVTLDLSGTAIEEVPLSIGSLSKLKFLGFENCLRLRNLPSSISNLTSLKRLILSGCSNITEFPQVPEEILELSLSGTAIEQVPTSIGSLSKLKFLGFENCRRLRNLPGSISNLTSLNRLILSGWSQVPEEILGLSLSGTAIEQVPSSIGSLSKLN